MKKLFITLLTLCCMLMTYATGQSTTNENQFTLTHQEGTAFTITLQDETYTITPSTPSATWYSVITCDGLEKAWRCDAAGAWQRRLTDWAEDGDLKQGTQTLKIAADVMVINWREEGKFRIVVAGVDAIGAGAQKTTDVVISDYFNYTYVPSKPNDPVDPPTPTPDPDPEPKPEKTAKDTLEFTTQYVMPEPDEKNNTYTFSLYSPDSIWKIQICYTAESMYGTFTTEDFTQAMGGQGKNYNYLRPANDMSTFFPLSSQTATITEDKGTRIELNALYSDLNGTHRLLVHAYLPGKEIVATRQIDMGHAYVTYNSLYEYYMVEAENNDYHLRFGFYAEPLQTDTLGISQMLMPELTHKASGKRIQCCETCPQRLYIAEKEKYHTYRLDLTSEQDTLYKISFDDYAEAIEIKDTVTVDCYSAVMTDYSLTYGIYELSGNSDTYNVSIAFNAASIQSGQTSYSESDFSYSFSGITTLDGMNIIYAASIHANVVTNTDASHTLDCWYTGRNARMYHISIPMDYEKMPESKTVVEVDFGTHVGRVDYSQGLGYVGIVGSLPGKMDFHTVLYHGGNLSGDFRSNLFDTEQTYLTFYGDSIVTQRDVRMATAHMDSVDGNLKMDFRFYAVDDTIYRCTLTLEPKEWLHGQDYRLDYTNDTGVQMRAMRMAHVADTALYYMQFQRADDWDDDGNSVGDAEFVTYMIYVTGSNGVAGTYSIGSGNLAERPHTFYEGGTEILLAPVVQTLQLTAVDKTIIKVDAIHRYTAYFYDVESQGLMENGEIYHFTGLNVLLCIDEEGNLLQLKEDHLQAIEDALTDKQHTVSKEMRNGVLVIRVDGREYTVMGQSL